jgi:hypothetical protein
MSDYLVRIQPLGNLNCCGNQYTVSGSSPDDVLETLQRRGDYVPQKEDRVSLIMLLPPKKNNKWPTR